MGSYNWIYWLCDGVPQKEVIMDDVGCYPLVKCRECGKVMTSKDAPKHTECTGHSWWDVGVKPKGKDKGKNEK